MASILFTLLCTPFFLSHYLFDIARYLLLGGRPVQGWTLNQAIRVRTVRLLLIYVSVFRVAARLKLKPGRERDRFEVIQPRSHRLYKGPLSDAVIQPETIGATWTPARPPSATMIGQKTTVALHFHGGAFVIGDGRDQDTGFLARTLMRHMGCTHVCTPQYRLSSCKGGRFPAALQDALTSYLHIVKELGVPASQLIVSGDSAGGNLALGLLRYINEYGQELDIPEPAAVALWSPWTDVSAAFVDLTSSRNYASDYLNAEFARWGASTITGHGAIDISNPYLSPLHHPFKMSTEIPVFVSGGEREVLCDEIKAFSKAFSNQGWPLHLVISKGCPHDFLLLGPTMGFHEDAEAAARDAKAFFSGTTTLYLGES